MFFTGSFNSPWRNLISQSFTLKLETLWSIRISSLLSFGQNSNFYFVPSSVTCLQSNIKHWWFVSIASMYGSLSVAAFKHGYPARKNIHNRVFWLQTHSALFAVLIFFLRILARRDFKASFMSNGTWIYSTNQPNQSLIEFCSLLFCNVEFVML